MLEVKGLKKVRSINQIVKSFDLIFFVFKRKRTRMFWNNAVKMYQLVGLTTFSLIYSWVLIVLSVISLSGSKKVPLKKKYLSYTFLLGLYLIYFFITTPYLKTGCEACNYNPH